MSKIPKLRFKEFNDDWEANIFKNIVKLQRGSSPRPIVKYITKSKDGVNWIKIGDILGNNNFINHTKEKITKEGAKKSRQVDKGEIILSNSMSYGKPIILNIDGYIHDGWFVIRKFDNYFDKEYLLQVLGSEWIQKQYKRLAAGGVVNNISSELVNSVKINLPPKQEQEKIASFLTSVDTKIEQLIKKETLLKEYKKGVMQKIFNQEIRFKADDGSEFCEWDLIKLNELSKVYDGTHSTPKYVQEGIPFYSVEHITANQFDKTKYISEEVFEKENKRVKLERNDILMSRIGDIGTSRLIDWDVNASFYVTLALIKKSEKFNSSFLNQFIKSSYFQRQLNSKTLHVAFPKKINLGEIGACKIKLPCIEEQNKIGDFLSSIDGKIKQTKKQLEETKEFKKALLQQMFV